MKSFGLIKRGPRKRKVFVIGLDCAAPELVFGRWRKDLPNLSFLADNGISGELESCKPAITVPAWSCMFSSKDPGVLGIYGFRNRADHSYDNMYIATASAVKEMRVWDYLSDAGKTSVVIGVPQTYPVKPLDGYMVSGFLTPSIRNDFTYPSELKAEILRVAPNYAFDVKEFRTEDKEWLLHQIYEMTDQHFRVIDHLLVTKPWQLFISMEIGVDRIHHGFWSFHDAQHSRYQAGNSYENVIHDYYTYLDRKIGDWLEQLDKETVVMVVSDHGAQRMDGGICINEWLWRNGYLFFEKDPEPGAVVSLKSMRIDWGRTRAWAEGGYYGRVFLNVAGREPQGVVRASDFEAVRDDLAERLAAIPDANGKEIGTRVFKPQDIYRKVRGVAPDLMVYFGGLLWRSVGSLGHDAFHTFSNDTGPDDCNHAENGLFILYDPKSEHDGQQIQGAQIMDIAPTIMRLLGLSLPDDLQGSSLA